MQCQFIKENGELCEAHAMKETNYCYLHNPSISEIEKKEIQAKGGRANSHSIEEPLPAIQLTDIKSIMYLLKDTVNRVRNGEMDVKTANCIGFLSNHLMKAYELDQIENKLDKVRQAISR